MQDLRRLAERSQPVLVEVFRLLEALDDGTVVPVSLHDYTKTGNLTDCGKIVVAVQGEPEHRIVVRDLGDGAFEVSEVIAVEDRTGDLPYLLAGLRLGRLDDPMRRSDAQRRVARIRQLRDR
jgi:hypothetical protein